MAAVIADVPSPNGKVANEEHEKDTLNDPVDNQSSSSEKKKKSSYNVFAAKKTVAQGMMDIALLTSNANQLRYVLQFGNSTRTYAISVALILLSILLQVAVGIILIFKGRSDLLGEKKRHHAHEMNKLVVIGVFAVTVINIFIASFTEFAEKRPTDFSIIDNYLSTVL